tara:strand:- start:49 stop:1239 length:1191 start_codon:yes stop_codon:yes gene_type:complete
MATKKGVWNLQQVRDKQLQDLWSYASTGMLFVWGYNDYGELGHNNRTDYSSPTQISGSWSRYASGGHISLMVNTSGELYAAGRNEYGALGQNSVTTPSNTGISSPVQIPGTTWASVTTVGQYQGAFATKTNGTLWAWGRNSQTESKGVLGQNNLTDYSSPVQVGSDTTWSTSSNHLATTGNGSVHAIKTDGTYWCWGYASAGQLGQGEAGTYYSSPVQIPGTTWAYVGTKGPNGGGGAIKTDGTLWMWGYNADGQLAQNNKTNYSSPRQVPGTTWSTINTGFRPSIATKTDGTLWTWGNNQHGVLGHNESSPVYRSSPTQVGSGTDWSHGIASAYACFATKTDGTMYAWGYNPSGQLGLNDRASRSSPTQVPGDWDLSKVRLTGAIQGTAISAISS